MLRGPDVRLRFVAGLLVVILLLILGRLVQLQVIDREDYLPQVEELVLRPYTLSAPPPGVIRDRNGDLLVGNAPIYNVGAEVNMIGDITETMQIAAELAPILDMSEEALVEKLAHEPTPETEGDVVWRPLTYGVGADAGIALRQAMKDGWNWLTLEPKWKRFYAEGKMACHTLGFINELEQGYGLEDSEHRFLRPKAASATGEVDVAQVPLAEELAKGKLHAYPGNDLVLTLDRTIQAYVEGELDKAMVDYGASGGTILVMDPRSGAILAVASRPNYEPFAFERYSPEAQGVFSDPAVSDVYEPGSVFKVITVAAALDSGSVPADWSYYDDGIIEYGGVVIANSDRQAYGWQDLQGVLDSSLNVGVATLTTQHVGADVFYQYVRAFGFGRNTDLGVTGEAKGIVNTPEQLSWSDSFLATNTFGQGIAVTPLQLATAVSALANHGTMMAPYLVAERHFLGGEKEIIEPRYWGQPISAETADRVAKMMANTVDNRYAMAQVPGYRIAGKSGTAQIPVSGGYDPKDVIVSFIGFGPLPDPELLILVKLDRPQIEPHLRWGTQTAAPVFQRVAERLFVLLGIPPSEMRAGP